MRHRSYFVVPLVVMVLAALRCGEDAPVAGEPQPPDEVGAPCISNVECGAGRRCALGVCVDESCRRNSDCASNSCDLLNGVCNPVQDAGPGTSSSDAGPSANDGGPLDAGPDAGTQSCTNKYECPPGKICTLQKCVDPAPDGHCVRDSQCPAGKICNAGNQQCIDGCADNRDCESNPAGAVCDATITPTYQCGKCDPVENPCPSGQTCVDLACVTVQNCTTSTQCSDGLICTPAGTCGNCSGDAQCGPGRSCLNGHCSGSTGCTDDAGCQATLSNPKAYCDLTKSPATCAIGQCNVDTDCTITGQICNITTHQCTTGGSTGSDCSVTGCPNGEICLQNTQTGVTFCSPTCNKANSCACPDDPVSGMPQVCYDPLLGLPVILCAIFGLDGYCAPFQ